MPALQRRPAPLHRRAVDAQHQPPFLLAPQPLNGQRLVDGFLCGPLPVGAAVGAGLTVAIGFKAPQPKCIDKPQRLPGSIPPP